MHLEIQILQAFCGFRNSKIERRVADLVSAAQAVEIVSPPGLRTPRATVLVRITPSQVMPTSASDHGPDKGQEILKLQRQLVDRKMYDDIRPN